MESALARQSGFGRGRMNFGFIINNRTCIGCHACSTACKSENEVPLGVYRTWVKYTEVGEYPNVKRNFQVTRCNHCANPPCARICPVTAMYQRDDGIVEFDKDECIGCKACMQACPYDAIYLDPDTHTAAKCHYCSHRTELGLEPACVVVCPEHAIIAGDLDDPDSEISRVLAAEKTTVRKPEQGTRPKLFYIDGHDLALRPTASESPESFMWADVLPSGPIQIGNGRRAEQMVQVGYNAQHKTPWHWPVPAYLVTKGIASGVFLLAGLFALTGASVGSTFLVGALSALIALAVTTALLVFDLERPERFLRILFRPQWRSWLTKGAFVLIGFSGILGLWCLLELGLFAGLVDASSAAAWRRGLLVLGVPLAVLAAVYTAFLFGQAEGRDLWQSPLLPAHLLIQAIMAGAAALWILSPVLGLSAGASQQLLIVFGSVVALDLFVILLGELGMPHASEVAARAAELIRQGPYRRQFWLGAIGLGHIVPLLALLVPAALPLAGIFVLVGLYAFEHAFVMAPQDIPNS